MVNGQPDEHHPYYRVWERMKHRCYSQSSNSYPRYGGRGITVCDRWKASLANFVEDMGPRPEGATLDRIDNNKGYCPENCKWSTRQEQASNRRDNVNVTFNGKTQTAEAWAREYGLSGAAIVIARLSRGWSIEKTLTTPPQATNGNAKRNVTLAIDNAIAKESKP